MKQCGVDGEEASMRNMKMGMGSMEDRYGKGDEFVEVLRLNGKVVR